MCAALQENTLGSNLPHKHGCDAVSCALRLILRQWSWCIQHGEQLLACLLHGTVDVPVLSQLFMQLECSELLFEGKVPGLAVTIHRGVLDDVRSVVPKDVRRAVGLKWLATEVKL